MALPTLPIVPPTPRADVTTRPQSYSDPSSSTLGTVHTQRTSSEATAEIIFSLYSDDRNSWHSTNAHCLFRNNSLCESGSDNRLMSTSNRDSSSSYLRQSSASSQTSPDIIKGQGACTQVLCTQHHPILHRPAVLHKSTLQAHPSSSSSQAQGSSKHDRPPSCVRSNSISPSGPYSSGVDAPTMTQSTAAAPTRPTSTPSHPSPPQRIYSTLQVDVNLPPR